MVGFPSCTLISLISGQINPIMSPVVSGNLSIICPARKYFELLTIDHINCQDIRSCIGPSKYDEFKILVVDEFDLIVIPENWVIFKLSELGACESPFNELGDGGTTLIFGVVYLTSSIIGVLKVVILRTANIEVQLLESLFKPRCPGCQEENH
uniref:Uncharacterized protein n=1 Tax=Glossina austeni TaxID=7395 RepID=A0A1A9UW13_GLOAU